MLVEYDSSSSFGDCGSSLLVPSYLVALQSEQSGFVHFLVRILLSGSTLECCRPGLYCISKSNGPTILSHLASIPSGSRKEQSHFRGARSFLE